MIIPKKYLLIVLMLFATMAYKSQSIISSGAYVQTCIQKTNCFSVNNNAYLFFDENSNELILKIDFLKIRSGKDTIDDWIDDLDGTTFYYIAHFNKEEFQHQTNNNFRSYKLNGKIYFNGIWTNNVTEMVLFQTSENSLMTRNTNDNIYDTFKVNFGFSFMPKDFKIHKRPHHLKKQITIGVTGGRVNLLKPEFRHMIKEVEIGSISK